MIKIHKKTHPKIFIFFSLFILLGILSLKVAGEYKLRKWDGKQRFTTIDLKKPVTIKSFDPVTNEGIAIILPDNLMVETVDGRGKWRADVMPQLAKKFGRVWATDSICDFLTIPCTALSSDLTIFDQLMWRKWSREVRWRSVVLADTAYVREVIAPDGESENVLASGWKDKVYDWFASGKIIRENLNVTIVNATAVSGLGSHAAGTVETAGMKVVMIKNSEKEIDKCLLETSLETGKALGVIWLSKKFHCDYVTGQENNGEVILTLGNDYARWLFGEDYSSALGISNN